MSKATELDRLRAQVRALKEDNARLRGAIPGMKLLDQNVSERDTPIADAPLYHVYSWSPAPAGAGGPLTQVHLVFEVPSSSAAGVKMSVALRLKTPRALDELVGVLLQHRRDVWPESSS